MCCYPDYERLLTAAAEHARRLLVFSHPPRNVVSRTLMTVLVSAVLMGPLVLLAISGLVASFEARAEQREVVVAK